VAAKDRGLTYREALDEALCFGWIDGVRRAADDQSFSTRFTPRKSKSIWSAVNIRRAKQLEAEGRGACLELLPGSGAVASAQQHFLGDGGKT
jgi:uncharacterized protein YdeI (YjbR/CyaY-like superfamily)